MTWLTHAAYQWYLAMNQLSSALSAPVFSALGAQNIPAISALLLGLLGGLAPCQMTANAGAIAYVTQAGQGRRSHWPTVWSFLAGKALVYILLGFIAAMLGLKVPTPFLATMRKLSGPLMIIVGLYLAGVIRWQGGLGARLSEWLQERLPRRGSPAFWLGVAFSLGFCPTMAMIFFGTLVPLIIRVPAGMLLPVIFAAGTTVPVILWALALTLGRGAAARWLKSTRSADRYIKGVAAAVFLLIGLNDTLIYWFT